jgi:hypothetical protein
MPVPSSYTEKTLAEFMHVKLGNVAKALDLHFVPDGPGDYAEAVNDALLLYGAEDISTISDTAGIRKIRALAMVAAWRHVVTNFAALFDFSADGASYNRSQLFDQASKALQLAEDAASEYSTSGAYTARLISVDHIHDPYSVRTEDELER